MTHPFHDIPTAADVAAAAEHRPERREVDPFIPTYICAVRIPYESPWVHFATTNRRLARLWLARRITVNGGRFPHEFDRELTAELYRRPTLPHL